MTTTTKPTKEHLREYLAQRAKSENPPPSIAEVRRALGWGLVRR